MKIVRFDEGQDFKKYICAALLMAGSKAALEVYVEWIALIEPGGFFDPGAFSLPPLGMITFVKGGQKQKRLLCEKNDGQPVVIFNRMADFLQGAYDNRSVFAKVKFKYNGGEEMGWEGEKGSRETGEERIGLRVSLVSIGVNCILAVFKLGAGLLAHSGAMVSDAVHSGSDVASTVIVMIGIKAAHKQSDREHEYGHERIECVASVILAGLLLVTGVMAGVEGIKRIAEGSSVFGSVPGREALAAALVSVAVKEWMYRYTRKAAIATGSNALMADAWHHRSDSLSSVGAFAGIMGARLGCPVLDSVASVGICLLVVKVGVDIFVDAVNKMVDRSCGGEMEERMRQTVLSVQGVKGIDVLRTRMFGQRIYVDIEIQAEGSQSLSQAHRIAENVHERIERDFREVKHCMVHVNPWGE